MGRLRQEGLAGILRDALRKAKHEDINAADIAKVLRAAAVVARKDEDKALVKADGVGQQVREEAVRQGLDRKVAAIIAASVEEVAKRGPGVRERVENVTNVSSAEA